MLFSVVMPVYNKAETVRRAIYSILRQTVNDFEIIVIDDGSTDDIGDVLVEFENLKNVNIIHRHNGGVSVARNTGILHASGEFICFLDADDEWLPDHLSTLKILIEGFPSISFYATSHITVSPCGRRSDSSNYLPSTCGDYIQTNNLFLLLNRYSDGIINTNSMCIRKSLLFERNLLFEAGEGIGEDTDLWYRVALYEPIVISKKATTVYRRDFSTATKVTSNSFSWVFAKRIRSILDSPEISNTIKSECVILLDRYTLTCCRDLAGQSKSHQARTLIKSIKNKRGKRYWATWLICFLPSRVSLLLWRIIGK